MPLTDPDRISITLPEAKDYLRVSGSEDDALIQVLIDASREQAERFLCHDFTYEKVDPVTGAVTIVEDPVPASIKLGCLLCIGRWYEYRRDGVQSERLGDESVTWEPPEEAKRIWRPYRKWPGL